ncbi:MAG: hypothetical protein LBS66_03910 [Rhodospirillaceae bacterium]|jgi:hypothetical protein|nr:hypothetical protein [Rhodospirillaceae bacterium]
MPILKLPIKRFLMKKAFILVFVLFTSGCEDIEILKEISSTRGAMPRFLTGNENQATFYDANGIVRMNGDITATKYCAKYRKIAEFKSQGGPDLDCVSLQTNYCLTYICK